MARKTWGSVPRKPLPNRLNIVVSTTLSVGPEVCGSVDDAIEDARTQGYGRIYAIGGTTIYARMLVLAHRILIPEPVLTKSSRKAVSSLTLEKLILR